YFLSSIEKCGSCYRSICLVALESQAGCDDQLVGRVDAVFQTQVETVVVVLAVGKCAVITVRQFIRQIMNTGELIRIVVGVVEKITAAHSHFWTPQIRIVDTKRIGFVDTGLLSNQKILVVAKSPTIGSVASSST